VALKEKNSLVELVLREGRNRQVKRMFLEVGHPVLRLQRTAYAFLDGAGLEPGQWRHLDGEEVKRLRAAAARAGSAPPDGLRERLERPLKKPREAQGGRSSAAKRPGQGRPGGAKRSASSAPSSTRRRER
jgi:23S rRNA pseudouridine2605 synthase